jgi:hypothetical protein
MQEQQPQAEMPYAGVALHPLAAIDDDGAARGPEASIPKHVPRQHSPSPSLLAGWPAWHRTVIG